MSFLPAFHKSQKWQLSLNLRVEETEGHDFVFSLLSEAEEPAQALANDE